MTRYSNYESRSVMEKRQLLGIDIGTSACKVVVFDESGRLLAQASRPYDVYYPNPGWAEQDPDQWWHAVCGAVREVVNSEYVVLDRITGIGVDGQGWSVVPIDRVGRCLAHTPIWFDTRARSICEDVTARISEDEIFAILGNRFLPSYCTPKVLWFKQERPDVYRNTWKFLQSNGYIVYRLTGIASQDYSQGYGIHFFDIAQREWNGAMADKLGLSPELFGQLCACDQVVGTVTRSAAEMTGLRAGIPVVAGGLDAASSTLGVGVYKPGQAQEQGGTAGGMSICTNRPLSHKKLILGTHIVPDRWLLQGGTVGGGGALKWFRNELAPEMSYDELTALAEEVPAGAEGVCFLPYLAGERSPIWDPDAKGVFYGLTFDKKKGHFARAVLEGVAYSLEHNLQTAYEAGVTVEAMNAQGGAANSALWTQMKADITGLPINVPDSDTASALGACILAGVGVGVFSDYGEAVSRTVTFRRRYEPDPERLHAYEKTKRLYRQLYKDLKNTFKEFR